MSTNFARTGIEPPPPTADLVDERLYPLGYCPYCRCCFGDKTDDRDDVVAAICGRVSLKTRLIELSLLKVSPATVAIVMPYFSETATQNNTLCDTENKRSKVQMAQQQDSLCIQYTRSTLMIVVRRPPSITTA